ncbi:MAG: hypothetical protein QM627_07460 [Luteolibacter sp.]
MTSSSLLILCCLLWVMGSVPLSAAESAPPEASRQAPTEEVRKLVQRYETATLEEKQAIYLELLSLRAWREILTLCVNEPEDVRTALEINLRGVAIVAAREALVAGDPKEAQALLEMTAIDADGKLTLAAFHRGQGTLEQAAKSPPFSSPDGQLAITRAGGQLEKAEKLATDAGNAAVGASMALLRGNPLPWLEYAGTMENTSLPGYLQAASQRWKGEPIAETDLASLRQLMSSSDETVEKQAIVSLFLLGEKAVAEARLQEFSPTDAFDYLDAIERPLEALQAHGFSPDQPDFANWASRLISRLSSSSTDHSSRITDDPGEPLLRVARFLERRGKSDVLADAYLPPLRRLAAKDPAAFLEFLEALFSRNGLPIAPRLATDIGIAWAENDEGRWRELRRMAVGESPLYEQWWDWISELKPDALPEEKLRALQALFSDLPDPRDLRQQWLDRAWHSIEQAPENEKAALSFRIYATCLEKNDAATFVRAWKGLTEEQRKTVLKDPTYREWNQLIYSLSAQGDWREVSDLVLGQIEIMSGENQLIRPELYACAASSLRRAGNPEKAAIYDAWAEKLALGDPSANLLIGLGYAFGHEYETAGKWFARALGEAPPGGPEFSGAIIRYAEEMLHARKWREAAAALEVIAQLHTSADYASENPLPAMRSRVQADLSHAMDLLPRNRSRALALLASGHALLPTDASLADHFFPAVREAGLVSEHDIWFEQSWAALNHTLLHFPDCDNLLNSTSWMASRALKQLDQAAMMQSKALALSPRQPAYLDTWAEIQLAKGSLPHAVEWSDRSLNLAPDDPAIRRQNLRFHQAR